MLSRIASSRLRVPAVCTGHTANWLSLACASATQCVVSNASYYQYKPRQLFVHGAITEGNAGFVPSLSTKYQFNAEAVGVDTRDTLTVQVGAALFRPF